MSRYRPTMFRPTYCIQEKSLFIKFLWLLSKHFLEKFDHLCLYLEEVLNDFQLTWFFFFFAGITTVLTMTFLGLEARTDLPKVPYPTALDFFVFLSFAFIFATIIQVSQLMPTHSPYSVSLHSSLNTRILWIMGFSLQWCITSPSTDQGSATSVWRPVRTSALMRRQTWKHGWR